MATKESVLAQLSAAGVAFEAVEHEAVATADAQAEALSGVEAGVTKNLFLVDKKRRQYLITALKDTKVDLKALSARLGLGKALLAWAEPELLRDVLGVGPGCVTPLALANAASCKHTVLLLDAKLQRGSRFAVHPIVNTCSVLLDAAGLDAFLGAVGRTPAYVDLEAAPKIDRDNPPDLRALADVVEPPPKPEGAPPGAASSASSSMSSLPAAAAAGSAAAAAAAAAAKAPKAAKAQAGSKAAKQQQQQQQQQQSDAAKHIALTNVVQRTDELVDMVSRVLLGAPASESAAAGGDGYALRRLRADVQMQLTAFKNAAYTAGYSAGKEAVVAFATKRYA